MAPRGFLIAMAVSAGGGCTHVVVDTTHILVIRWLEIGFVVKVGCHWIVLILGVHGQSHAALRVSDPVDPVLMFSLVSGCACL